MRALYAALVLVAACATAPEKTPSERLFGCWVNRDAGVVRMHWSPVNSGAGEMRGVRLDYNHLGGAERSFYSLDPSGDGFALCQLEGEQGAALRCWQVAQGDSGSLEGGRAFIDAHGDRLRITIVGAGPERVLFNGRRDSCR
jgi:hypothetical protein